MCACKLLTFAAAFLTCLEEQEAPETDLHKSERFNLRRFSLQFPV